MTIWNVVLGIAVMLWAFGLASGARPAHEEPPQEAGVGAGRALTQTPAACWTSRTRKASTMSRTPRMIANAATQAISSTALRP